MAQITLFRTVDNPKPVCNIDIEAFYNNIINGEFEEEVSKYRITGDKKFKKDLPCVSISGTFSYRENKSLIKHSGRICIDIDNQDNPLIDDWEALRDSLGGWDDIEFCSLSASGKGVFCIIKVAYPNRHSEHFLSLKQIFKRQGIFIDKGCKEVSRLRYVSWDKDAIYNTDSTLFKQLFKESKVEISDYSQEPDDIIKKIINEGVNITDDYDDWLRVGFAIAKEYGESGRKIFHDLSSISSKYNPQQCDSKYNSCLKTTGAVSMGTIISLYNKNKRH